MGMQMNSVQILIKKWKWFCWSHVTVRKKATIARKSYLVHANPNHEWRNVFCISFILSEEMTEPNKSDTVPGYINSQAQPF